MDGRVTFLIKITSPAKPSARDIYNRTIMDTTEETVASGEDEDDDDDEEDDCKETIYSRLRG